MRRLAAEPAGELHSTVSRLGANSPHKTRRARSAMRTLFIVSAAILTCAGIQSAVPGAFERLPASLQSQGPILPAGASARWRRSVAETLHADCKAGLARAAWRSPSVGTTEDGPSDVSAMRREFAHWRLAGIFRNCTELTQDILSAGNVQHEIRTWVKLTRLLGEEQAIQSLLEMAEFPPSRHDEWDVASLTEAGHWRNVRDAIFEATLKLLDETD